ncbi:MAG: RNA polymerase sigma factor SigW [Anaerolineae bacterium]|nr:MAG: RNA polymerase sigma factor SigW [Anaerolineae bacterium]
MVEPTDRDLVLRTRRGEVEAFGEIVARYQRSVFNVCYRMLGERMEAEDLAQETFIRAYDRLETFDVERPFGPWIRRVATNACLNHIQGQKPESFEFDEERDQSPAAPREEPETYLQGAQAAEEVRNAILELPPHYRAVIELRHYQEMSYSEIAETLELPISDVKSHLYRARRKLAALLSVNE